MLLNNVDSQKVDIIMKKTNYKINSDLTMGEFYTFVYNYFKKKNKYSNNAKDLKYLYELQEILMNKKYPWYSMVYALLSNIRCMEYYCS